MKFVLWSTQSCNKLNTENLIDFYNIKDELDSYFTKTIFNKITQKEEQVGLTDIYLYQLSDQDIDKIIESNELEIPQRWQGKELVEHYELENNAELRKLLKTGDRVINRYRRQNGLPRLKRIAQKENIKQEVN